MQKKRFKIALLGLGNMGRNHLRTILASDDFELVAVVDPCVAQLPAGSPAALPLFKDPMQLRNIPFDAALIATPTQTHFEMAALLLEWNKHLLVEKPLASTLEQAQTLVDRAGRAGAKMCVGNVERCNPAVGTLRQVLGSGLIGAPIHINATRAGRFPGEVKPGNHVILDLAVHELDVVRMALGPIHVVTSVCHATALEGIYDTAEILVANQGGVTASIHVNWHSPQRIRTLRVTARQGVCEIDYINQNCTVYGQNLRARAPEAFGQFDDSFTMCDKLCITPEKRESLKTQLEQFAACLRGQPHFLCHGGEMVESLWLVEQCVSKMATGLTPQQMG